MTIPSAAMDFESREMEQRRIEVRGLIHRGLRTRLVSALVLLALFGLWQLLTTEVTHLPQYPPPTTIAHSWYHALVTGQIGTYFLPTLKRMAIAYALAVGGGVALGVVMGRSRVMFHALEPVVELVRPVPIPALIPLAILALGIGDKMKITLIVFGSIFPIILSTYGGIVSINRTLEETGTTFDLSRWQKIREIAVPSALPSIFVGLRISIAIALIVAVVSEMIAGNSGAGYYVLQSQQTLQINEMYVGIVTLGILGYLLNGAVLLLERFSIGKWANRMA